MPLSLDLGLLEYFSIIFPAILIWVVVYMILEKTKLLGESRSLHAIIALVMAFLVIVSKNVAGIINFISPWFVLLFIFVLLLLMVYRFMGVSEQEITKFVSTDAPVIWLVFAIGIVIIIAGISHIYGQGLLTGTGAEGTVTETIIGEGEVGGTGTQSFARNISNTFFHPKIVGLIFVMLVAVFTIALLTRET